MILVLCVFVTLELNANCATSCQSVGVSADTSTYGDIMCVYRNRIFSCEKTQHQRNLHTEHFNFGFCRWADVNDCVKA